MPCCGRPRRSETDVQRTQRLLRNTLIGLLVLNVPHMLMGAFGLFGSLFWMILFLVAMRGLYRKNERSLRAFVSLSVCGLCCGAVFMIAILVAAGSHHGPRVEGPDSPDQPMLEQNKPLMATHDPTVLMETKEAPNKPVTKNDEQEQTSKPMMTLAKPQEQPEQQEPEEHSRAMAVVVFFFALIEMIFFSLQVASIMLAARLVRALRAERLSAPAMMMPAKDLGDVALAPMASTGAPQVFYMPTSDGQPQLVVYSPVPESA